MKHKHMAQTNKKRLPISLSPSAFSSTFISSAHLIKSSSNTGCNTSLSFTLPWLHSTHIASFPVCLTHGSSKAADATLVRKCSHLTSGISHYLLTLTAECLAVLYMFPLPQVKGNSSCSVVLWLPTVPCLSTLCNHCSMFLPAMTMSLPRRIEWVHYSAKMSPQSLPVHAGTCLKRGSLICFIMLCLLWITTYDGFISITQQSIFITLIFKLSCSTIALQFN